MKPVLKFACALAAIAIAVSSPVNAAKEKKDKKEKTAAEPASSAVKLKLSPEFLKAYAPAATALAPKDPKAKNVAAAQAAFPLALAAATTPDDKHQIGIFAVQLGTETKDLAMQKQGLDLLIASPFSPADRKTAFIFQKGVFAYNEKDYGGAEMLMRQAYDAGYRESNVEAQISNAFSLQKKYPEALVWIKRGIEASVAAGQKPTSQYYALAANYALKSNDKPASNYWLKELVKADDKPSNWHDAIIVYGRAADLDLQETLDMSRLTRATNSMINVEDYKLYFEAADVRRYPAEVLAVLEEGFAKGIISKNNLSFAELHKQATALLVEDNRTLAGTEASARTNTNGYAISLVADAFYSHREFAKAQSLYELALSKGKAVNREGVDETNRVLMRLALAKIGQNNWAGAKADMSKISNGKRQAIAEYWMIYIDKQLAAKPAV